MKLATCIELFVKDMSTKLGDIAQKRGSSSISRDDVLVLVTQDKIFDFLVEKVEQDLAQPQSKKQKKDSKPTKTVDNVGEQLEVYSDGE